MPDTSSSAAPRRKRRLPWWAGLALVGAIVYDLSPIDVIPEGFLGPFGFADDVALTTVVLALIGKSYFRSATKGGGGTGVTVQGTARHSAD